MKKSILSLVALALAMLVGVGNAYAQPANGNAAVGSGGAGLGLGAAAFLGGVAGVQVAYDQPIWHLEGLLGFVSNDNGPADNSTTTNFGVRGWYHLKQGPAADFSLGGGIGFRHFSQGNNSGNDILFEPGFQVRAFLTPNVALFGIAALSVRLFENSSAVVLDGQPVGGFGFTYYFR